MKRALYFLIFLAGSGQAQQPTSTIINKFGGLNTDDHALTLQDGMTPDSENVLTDETASLQPRYGFLSFSTTTASTLGVYSKANGDRYIIAQSSGNLVADKATGAFTTLVSTVSSSVVTVGTQLGDNFYFANTVDGLKHWDGASVTVDSATLKVNQLVTFKGRLVASGLSGSERTLFGSEYLVGNNFVLSTAPTPTTPFQITIGGSLDEPITALYSSFLDQLMWFKAHSFGSLYGNDRRDFGTRVFTDKIGTSYPESVQDCDGLLRFLGPQRTVWEFNGSDWQKISKGINSLMATLVQGDANARTYQITTQTDYGQGTFSNISSITVSGSIVVSTDNTNIDNPSFESNFTNWTNSGCSTSAAVAHAGTKSVSPGTIPTVAGGTYAEVLDPSGTSLSSTFYGSNSLPSNDWTQETVSMTSYAGRAVKLKIRSSNGNSVTSDVFISNGGSFTLWIYDDASASITEYFDDISVGKSTISSGTYVSASVPLGSAASSLGIFDATTDAGNATVTYGLYRDSDTVHTISSPTTYLSSQTISAGDLPTISTAAYIFASVAIVISTNSSGTRAHNDDLIMRWNEGSTLRAASAYSNQRYWLGVAVSSTANNRVLVYDRNRQWQKYSGINASAMTIYNSNLYFGNSSGLFQAETGHDDNGSSIASYYTTRRLALPFPNVSSIFDALYMVTSNSSAQLQTSYYLNGGVTANTLGNWTMNTDTGDQYFKLPFSSAGSQLGKSIDIKWSVSGTASWNILQGTLLSRPDLYPSD